MKKSPESTEMEEKFTNMIRAYERGCQKTCSWGFQPGPTQTVLYSHISKLLEILDLIRTWIF